jgi:multidrug efflux pump subunit AcrB
MDIAKFSITHKVITWMVILFCIGGGWDAYQNLSRYEDPEYTIKDALVLTTYPGATPKEVEEEVTEKLVTALQQLPQLKRTKSISRPGFSRITVTIKDQYNKALLPQVWDELRRKIGDVQAELPPGAGPSKVVDDYGDVFGMLYAMTGRGFSYREMEDHAIEIKKQLLLVPGVAKVTLTGIRKQAIFVEISRQKIASLGISLNEIYSMLKSQNLVMESGNVRIGDEYIVIKPSGTISEVDDIKNLVVRSKTSDSLIYLSDIAKVNRGYVEVPDDLIYFNNKKAITIGVSVVSGGNVVEIGERVNKRLRELQVDLPAGIQFSRIYDQPAVVDQSVQGFLMNLIEAIVIVLAVLIIFMGYQSGLIIAAILFLIVLGTLYVMNLMGISLERISLGALVIALGMLVDNAIVVTEGILIKVQQGIDKIKAASQVVTQTQWPLLGATIVGIIAFAPIGLSQDNTGEYAGSLFYVILISLLLSWWLAITVVPLFCYYLFKPGKKGENKQAYDGVIFRVYKGFLTHCLHNRIVTIAIAVSLLVLAILGFKFVPSGFFPNSTTPIFYIDYWRSEGSDIRAIRKDMLAISKHIRNVKEIKDVTLFIGKGGPRFMLVYSPEAENPSYGQLLIRVKDYREIPRLAKEFKQYIAENFPNSETQVKFIRLGPGSGSKIEARFSGPDTIELRKLAEQAKEIMHANPNAIDIRDDWRQKVKIIEPVYSETQGRLTGITREMLSDALQTAFTGKKVGIYRERDKLIPIVSRPPDDERLNVDTMEELHIWSDLLNKTVPLAQLVTRINTKWEDNIIARRNRLRTVTISCDPAQGEASVLFKQLQDKIEAIKLPPNYQLEWGGEYENSNDAQKGLAKNIPMGVIIMITIVVALFNAVRQPLIIWLCVPLSFIGVTLGLLLTYKPFDFMAILGFLSLTGMLIKNAIVLIDQIDLEISEGKPGYQAIVDSSLSRLRPVMLAALTTVLGMIPLLSDAFFVAMAVVIMFGLSFATLLTLIVVPVFYSLFFKIRPDIERHTNQGVSDASV